MPWQGSNPDLWHTSRTLHQLSHCILNQFKVFIFLNIYFRYQELYGNCVSKLAHPECIYTESHDREEQVKTGPNTSLSSSTRKLPSWMTGKVTTPTKQSLTRTDSASSTEEPVRYKILVGITILFSSIVKDRTDVFKEQLREVSILILGGIFQ